jgi:hypothetical protein
MSISELDRAPRTLATLATLERPEAVARLEAIRGLLDSCGDPQRLESIARAIPRHVATLAPEVCLAVRQLALALAHHGPRLPEDVDQLEPRLRIAWLQVRLTILDDPGQLETINDVELLRALVNGLGWSPLDVALPLPLLLRLARATDVRVRELVPGLVRSAIHRLALGGEQAFECLRLLAADPQPGIRRAVFAELREPWLAGLSPATALQRDQLVERGLDDGDAKIVELCIELAINLERRAWLLALVCDEPGLGGESDAGRILALARLGAIANEEDLEFGLALAVEDPLRFGAAARELLLGAHRHGAFVREPMLPDVLQNFDQHLGWTGEELVRVTHIARVRLIELLGELAADDRRWIRRASILAASVGTRAPQLIAELLARTDDPEIAAALIDAAGRSPEYDDEGALLKWLARIPEHVISVLRVKGGPASALRLRALIEDLELPAHLRPSALEALWALADDRRTLQRELSARLGPFASGLFGKTHLSSRDDLAANIVSDRPWSAIPEHELEPLVVLGSLCETGDRRFLPEVTRAFRSIFRAYVRDALAGDFTIKRLRMPELEQHIYRYGRHLLAHGRAVRRFNEDSPETGRDLLLALAIDWLREDPEPPICVALLETIGRHEPAGAALRLIEPLWRHRDAEVRRAAIEALLEAGDASPREGSGSGRWRSAGTGVRGLELSICRLSEANDPQIVRQALAAVARLHAGWAEPMVVAALRMPEMGIKKEAAAALAVIGTHRCVPALVEWLGYHDNTAFRSSLSAALDTAAGASAPAILVDALTLDGGEGSNEQRRRKLLHEALGGRLTLAAILRLARSPHPSHVALVEAVLAGEVVLANASSDELAAALHRAKLRPLPPSDDPTQRLRLEGFSEQAALELVAKLEPKYESQMLAAVRAGIAEWLTWLGDPTNKPNDAVRLVLGAATSAHVEHFDRLLDLAERSNAAATAAGTLARFVRRCLTAPNTPVHRRARALALVRASSASAHVGGLERFRLLRDLGAVRTRADLDVCLAACRIGPNLAHDSEQLLTEALAIPGERDNEYRELGHDVARALEQLRDGARDWHRLDPAKASAWLSETLDTRPLDLQALPNSPPPELKPAFVPRSREDLQRLHAALLTGDAQTRERAAALILAWPDARMIDDGWRPVLDAYLAGRIELGPHRSALAQLLDAWPDHADARAQAAELIPSLDRHQLRRMLPIWIDAWERGEPHADEVLRRVEQELLIPFVRARIERGDTRLLRVLRRSQSIALRTLVEQVRERAPDEVAHLLDDRPDSEVSSPATAELHDPIAGLSLDALVAMIRERSVDVGLAVRAIHAIAKLSARPDTRIDERGIDVLEQFSLDRRARIRSAALRALRTVAPRERSLQAATSVLAIETRSDVILQLVASIAHGRHEPGLAAVLEVLGHRDNKLRTAAREALLAWGPDLLPALRRAAPKARPDRRRAIAELIEQLESGE